MHISQTSFGKEKRKRRPGKEGKLGVEGMSPTVLETALRRAGATILGEETCPVRSSADQGGSVCLRPVRGGGKQGKTAGSAA